MLTRRARAARRIAPRPKALAWMALRALVRLGVAGLIVFHVWLLGLHVLSGRAFDPATAARWAVAGLVTAGFWALSRRGLPLFFGRRAVGLWLLVLLIHCSIGSGGAGLPAIPASITALAQVTAAALVIGAWLVVAPACDAGRLSGGRWAYAAPARIAGLPDTRCVCRHSPRPPPLV